MKLTKLSLLFVYISLIVIAFISCEDAELSGDVNQDRIYTTYELLYNGNKDVTYARATFRFGNTQGTLLKLSSPSDVSFEGDLLTLTTEPITNFTYYEKEYAGFIDKGTFVWTDINGKTFTNDILVRTIDYPDSLTEIPMDQTFELIWKGEPLKQDDKVIVAVNNIDTVAFEGQIFNQNDIGSTSVILSKDKLGKLIPGNGELYMDRKYNPDLTEATGAGGEIFGTYRPENLKVQIK